MLPVAEFQESITDAIPQIITLLESQKYFPADAFAILSEQGEVSYLLA